MICSPVSFIRKKNLHSLEKLVKFIKLCESQLNLFFLNYLALEFDIKHKFSIE